MVSAQRIILNSCVQRPSLEMMVILNMPDLTMVEHSQTGRVTSMIIGTSFLTILTSVANMVSCLNFFSFVSLD